MLTPLPPTGDLEFSTVLKTLIHAHRHLAELKGIAKTISNEGMLISTLALQEAQSSSEIENIITTQDQLYKFTLHSEQVDPVTKEVAFYANALQLGYERVKKSQSLTLNTWNCTRKRTYWRGCLSTSITRDNSAIYVSIRAVYKY